MPAAIIAGLTKDNDKRVQAALKKLSPFPILWQVQWLRSNSYIPGLAPSQCLELMEQASKGDGAHVLVFRGHEVSDERQIVRKVVPYFRFRWLDQSLMKLIPHRMENFFVGIGSILSEELEWAETVKPRDESCSLLLPECAFAADKSVRHLWTSATEASLERIKLASRAHGQFKIRHWSPHKQGSRNWIDTRDRVFEHKGARHGLAQFPRNWKYSYQISDGFHFDVTSKDSREFQIDDVNRLKHTGSAYGHINIDPHGYVR